MVRCKTCKHAERARAELMLASGVSIRAVSRKFGLDYHCVRRHWLHHVSDTRKTTLVAGPLKIGELVDRATEEGKSVLDHLRVLRAIVYDQMAAAHEANDRHAIGMLAGRALEILRELGRVTGELVRVGAGGVHIEQANFFLSPVFHQFEAAVLEASRRHPEARMALVSILREVESRNRPLIEGRDRKSVV